MSLFIALYCSLDHFITLCHSLSLSLYRSLSLEPLYHSLSLSPPPPGEAPREVKGERKKKRKRREDIKRGRSRGSVNSIGLDSDHSSPPRCLGFLFTASFKKLPFNGNLSLSPDNTASPDEVLVKECSPTCREREKATVFTNRERNEALSLSLLMIVDLDRSTTSMVATD